MICHPGSPFPPPLFVHRPLIHLNLNNKSLPCHNTLENGTRSKKRDSNLVLQPKVVIEMRDDVAAEGGHRENQYLVESGGGGHAARGTFGVGADLEGRVGGDELGEDV